MQADKPPLSQGETKSPWSEHSVSERALQIQEALKRIVLQTAYALRSRAQLAKLNGGSSSLLRRVTAAEDAADESATSLEPLGAECAQYLALVQGLRDYLLHAQAALEIELEAATQREAAQASQAADALRLHEAPKVSEKDGQSNVAPNKALDAHAGTDSKTALSAAINVQPGNGEVAGEPIVIDSDGGEDKDDNAIPMPKTGSRDQSTAEKPVDLTDSPDLPLLLSSAGTHNATSTMSALPSSAADTNTGLGINVDLSALGMNLGNLGSFDLPASSQSMDASTLASADNNFSDFTKMMGMNLASFGDLNGSNSMGASDFSSFSNPQSNSIGNTMSNMDEAEIGGDINFFSTGDNGNGLDLSNFDFSSLGADSDFGSHASNGGGVDLSAFLNTFGNTAVDKNDNNSS